MYLHIKYFSSNIFSLGIAIQQSMTIVSCIRIYLKKYFSGTNLIQDRYGYKNEVFDVKKLIKIESAMDLKSQVDAMNTQISKLKTENRALKKEMEKVKLYTRPNQKARKRLVRIERKPNHEISFE